MSEESLEVWVIDDEMMVLENIQFNLETAGYRVRVFEDPRLAEAEIAGHVGLLIVVLDHDFSLVGMPDYKGYDFAKFAKRVHWSKCVLPIVYLTGRETSEGFSTAKHSFGGSAPDSFLSKAESHLLVDELAKWEARLLNFEATIDEHNLEIALGQYCDWAD